MRLQFSRSGQIAAHLREQIRCGELVDPLPSTRSWSQKLGVSRPTLESALHQLQREGLLVIHPRGVRIAPGGGRPPSGNPTVRVLYYGLEYPEIREEFDWIVPLSERLHYDGIELTMQRCSAAQLRAIAEQKAHGNQLFLLSSLPAQYQSLFGEHRQPAIILGELAKGLSLPFVTIDQEGAIQHAVQTLVHGGHTRLSFVTAKTAAPGIRRTVATFESACARSPHQPIDRHITLMPLYPQLLETTARRLAARVTGKLGMIVVDPVPVSMVMTALLQRGVAVPGQVEMIAVLSSPDSIAVCPRPTHYPFPVNRFVKVFGDAVVRFFGTGAVPSLRKTLDVEIVRAS